MHIHSIGIMNIKGLNANVAGPRLCSTWILPTPCGWQHACFGHLESTKSLRRHHIEKSPFQKCSSSEPNITRQVGTVRAPRVKLSAGSTRCLKNWHGWTSGKHQGQCGRTHILCPPSCLGADCYFQQLPEAKWKALLGATQQSLSGAVGG